MKKINKYFLSFVAFLTILSSGNTLNVSAENADVDIAHDTESVQVEETEELATSTEESKSEDIEMDEEIDSELEDKEEKPEEIIEETKETEGDVKSDELIERNVQEDKLEDEENRELEEEEASEKTIESDEGVVSEPDNNEAAEANDESDNKSENKEEPSSTEQPKAQMSLQAASLNSSIQELDHRPEVRTVAYHATISAVNGNVHNIPNNLNGSVQLNQVTDYNNQNVIVRREGLFANRTWILVEKDEDYIGWMLKDKIIPEYEKITSDRTVAFNGLMQTTGRYQIFNRPAYTEGNYQVSDSSNFTGESVIARGEIETDYENPRVWTLIEINGELVGWINSRALTPVYNKILDEKTVAYDGSVDTNGRYQIFSKPAYTEGNYQVADSSDYSGENITVRGETHTDYYGGTTWNLIESNGKEIGWINSSAISPDYDIVAEEKIVAYEGIMDTNGRYQIFSRPAYTKGNYQVANSSEFYGNNIIVRNEIETEDNRTWALLESNGTELGWINKRAITPFYDEIISSRSLDHPRVIRNLSGRYQLFSKPAYTEGNQQVDNILNYAGQSGMITREIVTNRAVWHLLSMNGQQLGWINDKGLRKPRIYLDPGHGGHDSGASFGGVHEKNLNLPTALYLRDRLEETGYYNVIMSREKDEFVELKDISGDANKQKPDIFVSIHYNSMGGAGTARGIETFIHHRVPSGFGQETNHNKFKTHDPRIKESLDLAKLIHSNLISDTGMYDRGVKGNNYHVVRETNMPAVLLELGFLDNASERNRVNNSAYRRTAGNAIVKGINQYFKQ